MMEGKIGVVIVAAGKGTRMKSSVSKQFLHIQHKPIIVHTLERFTQFEDIDDLVMVVGSHDMEHMQQLLKQYAMADHVRLVTGGSERQDSVYQGLLHLSNDVEWVVVHDGVRPFVSERVFRACLNGAQQTDAAIAAIPVKDTVKVVIDGTVQYTPDRQSLWAIQTPQAFRFSSLIFAHLQAGKEGFLGTDDAMLMERAGYKVRIIEGSELNVKITTPEDLAYMEWKLEKLEREQNETRERLL